MPNVSKIEVDEIGGATGTTLTLTTGHVITGSTGQFQISGGTAGQALTTDGTGNLTFVDMTSDPTMGGDISGTASNAQIAANAVTSNEIANNAVTGAKISFIDDSVAVTDGHVLVADGTDYNNVAVSGDISITNAGVTAIAAGAVGASEVASTIDLSSKTVTLPAASVTAHVTAFDDNQLKEDIALLAFKQATSDSVVKYDLVDQTVDVFSDASGINTGNSTNGARNSSGKYYSGAVAPSGGTVTTYGSYTVHSFLDTGNTNFVVGSAGNVDVLVVGGGGGAGTFSGGGGGAGGFRTSASHAVTAQTYVVTVGAGGTGGYSSPSPYTRGGNGGDSVFDTVTAAGGGGGSGYYLSGTSPGGADGGSGGGSGTNAQGYSAGSGGAGNTPSTSPSQGNAGGDGRARDWPGAPNVNHYGGGGGGGGAGGAGVDSCNMTNCGYGGDGGDGATNDYRTGSNVTYAGGGSGAAGESYPYGTPGPNGTGGDGGGGQSQTYNATYAGAYIPDLPNGGANTGGGGGGGVRDNWGGYGGSGIVVVRYTTGDLSSYGDMTLVSNSTTAQSAPTKADLVMTYTNGAAGTATIGTDLTAEVSRDGGTTWTSFGLSPSSDQGDTGGHTILTAHDIDISGQPSGTSMQYRIKTLNQSVTKQTRIHAVSLGWS
jgi:hypothetical protein